ncbi:helix-turn-helix domain-containing protein [Streptomyces sp. AA0539]|uniref:helix-turn-helix domain-containing protein n=1 Tax=Streptomyces sp. AA0539 TaxID=1210045 RepID=UPI00192B112A|nr:helix-turn-helix transcriptional regulator [Streptomyces sp. AA0539]
MASPSIQRRRLGIALRRAREQAGKTQEEAARTIDAASTKVSRMELGQNGIKLTDLNVLLDLYGVDGEQADWMRDLARSGRQRGRWGGYRNVIPDWFRQYLDLEEDATELRWYQAELVPGILQTEGYVRALHTTAPFQSTEADSDRQVKVRMERASVIDGPDAPQLRFILSESSLWRNVGGKTVMRGQLKHLAAVAQRPNIQLQVLPFDSESYETATFGFTILRFDHDASTDVVYLEDYMDADYLDRPDAVRAYLLPLGSTPGRCPGAGGVPAPYPAYG